MKKYKLFSPIKVGAIELNNRIVMAPMTRCRAIDAIPNELMATYYQQRASAGLIITEGTSPSPNGLGYARIPGIFSEEQILGWKKTTTAVHNNGGKIIIQLMHSGRISHKLNMAEGTQIIAPSAIKPAGQMWTDAKEMQDYPTPKAMTAEDIVLTQAEYVTAAKNAVASSLYQEGTVAFKKKAYGEAAEKLNSSLAYDKNNKEVYYLLAVSNNNLKKYDESVVAADMGITLEEQTSIKLARFYYEIAKAYEGKQDSQNACANYKKA
ncbi:alkene reductase, partial [bacterium]|nr:alkene reductase [bacterium]